MTQPTPTAPWYAIPGLDAEAAAAFAAAEPSPEGMEALMTRIADADITWGGTVAIPGTEILGEIEEDLDLSF